MVFIEKHYISPVTDSPELSNSDEYFVNTFQAAITSNIAYFFFFLVVFASAAIPNSLLSLRAFCLTCCAGKQSNRIYLLERIQVLIALKLQK